MGEKERLDCVLEKGCKVIDEALMDEAKGKFMGG
jgi:hypothetical protein